MAVDTRRKRFAMLNFGDDIGAVLPVPDGTITALDRATLLALYSFTDADEGGAAAVQGMILLGRTLGIEGGMKGTRVALKGGRI